jgi:hypothetical protein
VIFPRTEPIFFGFFACFFVTRVGRQVVRVADVELLE